MKDRAAAWLLTAIVTVALVGQYVAFFWKYWRLL